MPKYGGKEIFSHGSGWKAEGVEEKERRRRKRKKEVKTMAQIFEDDIRALPPASNLCIFIYKLGWGIFFYF